MCQCFVPKSQSCQIATWERHSIINYLSLELLTHIWWWVYSNNNWQILHIVALIISFFIVNNLYRAGHQRRRKWRVRRQYVPRTVSLCKTSEIVTSWRPRSVSNKEQFDSGDRLCWPWRCVCWAVIPGVSRGAVFSPCLDFLWQQLPDRFLFDGQHKGEGFNLTRQIFMNSRKLALVAFCSPLIIFGVILSTSKHKGHRMKGFCELWRARLLTVPHNSTVTSQLCRFGCQICVLKKHSSNIHLYRHSDKSWIDFNSCDSTQEGSSWRLNICLLL